MSLNSKMRNNWYSNKSMSFGIYIHWLFTTISNSAVFSIFCGIFWLCGKRSHLKQNDVFLTSDESGLFFGQKYKKSENFRQVENQREFSRFDTQDSSPARSIHVTCLHLTLISNLKKFVYNLYTPFLWNNRWLIRFLEYMILFLDVRTSNFGDMNQVTWF